VQHGSTYANLTAGEDVLSIGLNRAVTLIEEKRARGPRKGRFGATAGRLLGEHPEKGGPIVVKSGRYGPYVSHGGINATLGSEMAPESVSLDQAVALLQARAERAAGKKEPSKLAAGPRSSARKPKAKSKSKPAAKPKPAVKPEKKRARKANA
jgi:DNA topoisomerase-1